MSGMFASASALARAALAAVRKADWDESQHPREENGRFGDAGGSTPATGAAQATRPNDKQLRALASYSQGAHKAGNYVEINNALAGQTGGKLTGARLTKAQNLGREINEAVAASPLASPIQLHRGGSVPLTASEGSVISSPRLVSATTDERIASSFVRDSFLPEGHGPAMFRISAPAGAKVLNLGSLGGSKFDDEQEHLFGSNQRFSVARVDRSGAVPIYYLDALLDHGVAKAAWDETQHPRDENGRFGTTGGGKEIVGGRAAGEYADYTESDHLDASKHYSYAALTLRGGAKKEANRLAQEHADAAARVGRSSANRPGGQATSGAQNDRSSPQIKLSKAQTDSIREYIGNDDAAGINAVLRGQDADDYDAEEQAHFLSLGRNISQAAADNPLTRSETLYRASYMPPGLKPGSVVATGSLLSATTDKSVADEFFSSDIEFRPGMSLITIRAAAGSLALNTNAVAGLRHEHAEHIVASNQPLHIVSVKTRTDADKNVYRIIEAELRPPKVSKAACDQREQT